MENKDLIVAIFCIGGGLFCILASILNWNFFFESRKAKLFLNLLGRNGARIFYSLLGLALIFLSYKILTATN